MSGNIEKMDQKEMPHSVDAEQALLGGLLLDPTAWDKIKEMVDSFDFYCLEHIAIFTAMKILSSRNQPITFYTVYDWLKGFPILHKNYVKLYLLELLENTKTAANVVSYGEIVRERAILRRLIKENGGKVSGWREASSGVEREIERDIRAQVKKLTDLTRKKGEG